jgi:heme-degrading monooxygenase HmoA
LFARLTRYEGASPDSIEDALETKKRVLPTEYGQTEGMKGTVFLVDRENGAILVMSLWESAEAMSASEADAARIRADVTSAGETASVENYEVAIFAVEQTPPMGNP